MVSECPIDADLLHLTTFPFFFIVSVFVSVKLILVILTSQSSLPDATSEYLA